MEVSSSLCLVRHYLAGSFKCVELGLKDSGLSGAGLDTLGLGVVSVVAIYLSVRTLLRPAATPVSHNLPREGES